MKKKKSLILWGLLLMSLTPTSQGAKEKCDPSLFRQKKEEALRLLRENPHITIKELAENINEPVRITNKIVSEIRKEKVKEEALRLLRENPHITIKELTENINEPIGIINKIVSEIRKEKVLELIRTEEGIKTLELMEILGVSENTIISIIRKLKDEGLIERVGRSLKDGFYRVLKEGDTPLSLEEQKKQQEEKRNRRKEKVVELIQQNKRITVSELAEKIGVSEGFMYTVLVELKNEERIERVHIIGQGGFYRIPEEGDTPLSLEEQKKQRDDKVVELMRKYERITIEQLAEKMGVSEGLISKIIRKLKDEKRIERVGGTAPSGFYHVLE